eukprot:7874147-Alexandrium_andersonii.AAC.1
MHDSRQSAFRKSSSLTTPGTRPFVTGWTCVARAVPRGRGRGAIAPAPTTVQSGLSLSRNSGRYTTRPRCLQQVLTTRNARRSAGLSR